MSILYHRCKAHLSDPDTYDAPDARDMASVYRERISDERLRAVADHVRQWLFGDAEATSPEEPVANTTTD